MQSLRGINHLVQCNCVLPQYQKAQHPIFHQFKVFSILDESNDTVQVKYAQCPNCGVIHKVIEISKSEIIAGKDHFKSLPTIDEIKLSIPKDLVTVLDNNKCDLSTFEMVQFIIENEKWGEFVVLTSDIEDGVKNIKYLRIIGKNLFEIKTHMKEI